MYPLQERLMKRPTFDYVESLERTQWLTRGEVERLQMEKLRALLRIAVKHSPWHAERIGVAGLDLSGERS
ncbi:MAG TPA: phenylacetate--CoA ligase family protein, partial [Casimicrobiaceae bacterium]